MNCQTFRLRLSDYHTVRLSDCPLGHLEGPCSPARTMTLDPGSHLPANLCFFVAFGVPRAGCGGTSFFVFWFWYVGLGSGLFGLDLCIGYTLGSPLWGPLPDGQPVRLRLPTSQNIGLSYCQTARRSGCHTHRRMATEKRSQGGSNSRPCG